VSPPKKGISLTPVSALDFESLYPSIIMAHNLSPEKVIEPYEVIKHDMDTKLIEIPFQKDNYSDVLKGHVLARKDKKGDLNVSAEIHGIGVYPSILEFLFASRKEVKLAMEHLNHEVDALEALDELTDI